MAPASCDDPRHAELLGAVERLVADNREQAKRIAALTKRCDAQDREIADLQARLGRDSSNSSKPPSSDPPFAKVKRPRTPSDRKRGGQPGHPGSSRALLDTKDVAQLVPHWPKTCACGCALPQVPDGDPVREQIAELPPVKPVVTEHQFHAVVCPICRKRTVATRTADMPKGSFGPRGEATVLYLMGACRLSVRETKRLFEDLLDFEVSTGALMRIASRGSTALAPMHADALAAVRSAGVKHADETGWFLRGVPVWLWLGEQSMRKPVMTRRDSLGSQSEWELRLVERMLTVIASLCAQGRDVLASLAEALSAAPRGRAPPSILPGLSRRPPERVRTPRARATRCARGRRAALRTARRPRASQRRTPLPSGPHARVRSAAAGAAGLRGAARRQRGFVMVPRRPGRGVMTRSWRAVSLTNVVESRHVERSRRRPAIDRARRRARAPTDRRARGGRGRDE